MLAGVLWGYEALQYNLVTIKFKIPLSKATESLFVYKELIRSFRSLQDIGILEVKYFDNKRIEKEIEE